MDVWKIKSLSSLGFKPAARTCENWQSLSLSLLLSTAICWQADQTFFSAQWSHCTSRLKKPWQWLNILNRLDATKTVCNPASSANLLIGFSDMPNGSATCHACNPVQIKNKILRGSRYELLYWIWMGQHGQHTWKNKIPMGLSSSVQKFYWKPTWPHPWKIFFKIVFASRRRIYCL